MNRKQIICLLIGILVAGCLLLYPPISIEVGNLRFWAGDPKAELTKTMTFHRFMPEGCFRVINWVVLCVEWFIVAVIDCGLIYIFRDKMIKTVR